MSFRTAFLLARSPSVKRLLQLSRKLVAAILCASLVSFGSVRLARNFSSAGVRDDFDVSALVNSSGIPVEIVWAIAALFLGSASFAKLTSVASSSLVLPA